MTEHRISYTSLTAYRESVLDGTVTAQHGKIMRVFYKFRGVLLNRRQVSELTDLKINAVTGRVRSLIDSGLLEVGPEKRDPITGRKVEYLKPVLPVPEHRQRRLEL
ncbi:hypothetical protein LCGC14_2216150 [marine sediment metagenome]|uniref:HTH marR-type domain-containing protein n=1 Tax=marine sediment metagenome TaxID=412755 RepID=A0A0F9G820_9ZZZZ